MNIIDNLLSVTATEQYSKVHDSLWSAVNEEISLPECNIYSYNPDLQSGKEKFDRFFSENLLLVWKSWRVLLMKTFFLFSKCINFLTPAELKKNIVDNDPGECHPVIFKKYSRVLGPMLSTIFSENFPQE